MRASAMPMSFSAFFSVSVSNSLLPTNVDAADRRALLHRHDQHAVLHFEPDVAEEAGGVERLDRLGRLFVVDALADLDRQIAEDGAGLGSLHAFDTDVAHDERLEGARRRQRPAARAARNGEDASGCSRRATARGNASGRRGHGTPTVFRTDGRGH